MKLEELTGSHILKGIETGEITREDRWGELNCNYIKFTLDETTYMAIEDPDDGYRSYMEELQTTEEPCRIKVPDIQVVCHMREDEYEACDVLEFIDAMNGKKILAVGTANIDDYYPYCVMEYTPENMYCNEEIGVSRTQEVNMPYIDRCKLLKDLCKTSAPTPGENWIVQKCIEIVNKQPTADVVPTSMVDETTKQFLSLHDKYQEQQVEIEALRGAANSYKMHYENLAREIFEEIKARSMYDFPKMYYTISRMALDELKIKYTEGKDEKGSN